MPLHPAGGERDGRTLSAAPGSGCVPALTDGSGLRSQIIPPEGVELWLHVSFEGRPEAFLTRGRIVRSEPDGLAVIFLDEPPGLETLLRSAAAPGNPPAAACS